MPTYLIIVACAVGVNCPLPRPVTHTMPSTSVVQCKAFVATMIGAYGYDPKLFSIDCKLIK